MISKKINNEEMRLLNTNFLLFLKVTETARCVPCYCHDEIYNFLVINTNFASEFVIKAMPIFCVE